MKRGGPHGRLCLLRCCVCGFIFPIRRNTKSVERPAGHIKHMWCPRCASTTPHRQGRAG